MSRQFEIRVLVFALGITPALNAAPSCVERLGEATQRDAFRKAVVSGAGIVTTQPEGKALNLVKFKSEDWVVTCRSESREAVALVRGEAVEIRQEQKLLHIRMKNADVMLPIVCIEKVRYVE